MKYNKPLKLLPKKSIFKRNIGLHICTILGLLIANFIFIGSAEADMKDILKILIEQLPGGNPTPQPSTPPQGDTSTPQPSACSPSFSPATFQGRTGKVAFYNEWNIPVTVILYHPNSRSIYNRYTVPPGQNQSLGDNIIVGDDWGVCFENKPSASGLINNLGSISIYNSDFQGSPLFMIQNGQIK
jgi:hypothetical protein